MSCPHVYQIHHVETELLFCLSNNAVEFLCKWLRNKKCDFMTVCFSQIDRGTIASEPHWIFALVPGCMVMFYVLYLFPSSPFPVFTRLFYILDLNFKMLICYYVPISLISLCASYASFAFLWKNDVQQLYDVCLIDFWVSAHRYPG